MDKDINFAREAKAHDTARRSWLAAEAAKLRDHRAKNAGGSGGIGADFVEVTRHPVSGQNGDAGMLLFKSQDEALKGDIQCLNRGHEIVRVAHLGGSSVLLQTLFGLIDSGKRKLLALIGRAG